MVKSKCYGHVHVSTREQNGDSQLLALRECGILDENVFTDKQSGKDFNRPKYQRLMRKLKPDE